MLLKAQGGLGAENMAVPCCPFIVQLLYKFEDKQSVYLCMELARHGDLYMNLRQMPHNRFDVEIGRFYSAEIALALKWLHSKRIAFRDLKQVRVASVWSQFVHACLCDSPTICSFPLLSSFEGKRSYR
jgi:serine/threonine protein kinase